MIPKTGDVTLNHVLEELDMDIKKDTSLGHDEIRRLAGKTGSQDISLGDLRGKSTGKKMKRISISAGYNNGSNSYGSKIGIKSIYVYDWKGNEIKNNFTWRYRVVHEKKGNKMVGTYNLALDNNDNTEFYIQNSSSGDANYTFEVYGESSVFVRVKRIRVVWGSFSYSSGHDGTKAMVISNGTVTSDGWLEGFNTTGSLDYNFYHHRGGSTQPPTVDITYND